jgi:Asp-tRNA(Asn)/Glu-tRNA(Gln) amidotransferase A subunit family amidase
VAEVLADPIAKNSALGEFTHFGNVLDLTGISVPAGTYPAKEPKTTVEKTEINGEKGTKSGEAEGEATTPGGSDGDSGQLPFGVTLIGGSRMDADILEIARRFEEAIRSKVDGRTA